MNKKNILLLTSASFSNNSTGISQTLENLFDNYSTEELLLCSPVKPVGNFSKYLSLNYELPRYIRKLPFLNNIFKKLWHLFLIQQVKKAKIDTVVLANLDEVVVTIATKLRQNTSVKLIVYLLDNIQENPSEEVSALMSSADGHIFISKYMAEANLLKFPSINKWMVAHNPVAEEEIASESNVKQNKSLHLAYAGAIWPMHHDALILVATALKALKKEGVSASLSIYTSPYFYEKHKAEFEELQIVYAGFVPFSELKPLLKSKDGLVITSSFKDEYKNITAYSIQTKVTDYLACGVPVISVGPDYAACNKFIAEHNVGWCFTTHNKFYLANNFRKFYDDDILKKDMKVFRGLELIRTRYRKEDVQNELNNFLELVV